MVIRIMKREALEIMKSNLDSIYNLYYTNSSNKWMWDICGGDPFVDYKVVPDFELSDMNRSKGEIDLENCKILYKNLMFITESQACDERLWAGLCNDLFYSYMKKRWNMYSVKGVKPEKAIGEILTRFFFKGGARSGIYRNTLSKCWWVGRNTYDPETMFKSLNIIGSNDLIDKMNILFRDYNFSANPDILKGIVAGLEYLRDEDIKYSTKNHLKQAMRYINAVGGGTLLDCWSSDDVKQIFIDQMLMLINGKSTLENNEQEEDSDDEDEIVEDENDESSEDPYVLIGSRIGVKNLETDSVSTFVVDFTNSETHFIPPIPKAAIGKHVNDEFEVDGVRYQLIKIE